MDLRKLKTLIDLVSESNVSELEITEAEGREGILDEDIGCDDGSDHRQHRRGEASIEHSRSSPAEQTRLLEL